MKVLQTKEFSKWNWKLIAELVDGPLSSRFESVLLLFVLSNSRLEDCIGNDFVPRLISFYRPSKLYFSTVPRSQEAAIYVRVGRALLEALLNCNAVVQVMQQNLRFQGVSYLRECKLVSDICAIISEELNKADPTQSTSFSSDKISRTLTREYFTFLGVLSSTDAGLEILNLNNTFLLLNQLVQSKSREDHIRLLLTSLNYETSLSTFLLNPSVRILAVHCLRCP